MHTAIVEDVDNIDEVLGVDKDIGDRSNLAITEV